MANLDYLTVTSERSRLATNPYKHKYAAPSLVVDHRKDVLCRYCETIARNSKIAHQPPKIDWLQDVPDGGDTAVITMTAYDPEYPDVFTTPGSLSYVVKVLRADDLMKGPGLLTLDIKGLKAGATYLMDGQPHPRSERTLKYPRTDDDEVFLLAREWLNTCLTEHVSCSSSHV
jgi:hypothetical protein